MSTDKLAIHLALLVISSVAASAAGIQETVLIRLFASDQMGGPNLSAAEAVAATILASAGVCVRWQDGDRPAKSKSASHGDTTHLATETIDIRFVYSTPPGKPGALAEALPFTRRGVRITVFLDRVTAFAGQDLLFAPRILGHVLAHEIGHVLRGMDGHSGTGVMKAHWDDNDYCTMRARGLKFAHEDVTAIASYLVQVRARTAER